MTIVIQKDDGYHAEFRRVNQGIRMGHSQAEKGRNRERILDEAARQIRKTGLEALSVGKLMQQVDLTHGGFYGHFASRSELIAHALRRALAAGKAQFHAARDPGRARSFAMMVRSYLSRTHRDSRGTGCAMAALISDVARADELSRQVMEESLEEFIATVSQTIGDRDETRAISAVSAMIGAIVISRVMTDEKRSDAILRAVRQNLIASVPE
jgi:TetR/AcrR family transcriptional repressor of nem operon